MILEWNWMSYANLNLFSCNYSSFVQIQETTLENNYIVFADSFCNGSFGMDCQNRDSIRFGFGAERFGFAVLFVYGSSPQLPNQCPLKSLNMELVSSTLTL